MDLMMKTSAAPVTDQARDIVTTVLPTLTETGLENVNVTTAGPDPTVQTTMANVIANVTTAATDQAHMTVTAVLRMPYVTTMQKTYLIRNVSATNGGQEMTVASIVDHVPQHVTDALDQMLTNVRTV